MNILFLCTGNSCRSQMAEAWGKRLWPEIGFYSAGVERHGLNPHAVAVMGEVGVDMAGHKSKMVDDLPDVAFDYIVTLCGHAAENCPFFAGGGTRVHRGFDDPPSLAAAMSNEEKQLDVYRRVRDEIREMVAGIPGSLED
ncbi:arsenate reductase ArsC [Pseudodesulfovibrio senegalensis]|jgi:arsenate reductase|uniref:Arsenate reductase ArsC n=1 Tax=Pseudodesulfovibrio senegalensis TaxID=1721087 RepID=A0A6N6N647_9BACT|nr:arsenate reductase ArsC [Pseudodesulfovibrio senegalensis]KAB1443363.1 arsenate reductase ArsC [Pseudodesulfovibrio senegalensis]